MKKSDKLNLNRSVLDAQNIWDESKPLSQISAKSAQKIFNVYGNYMVGFESLRLHKGLRFVNPLTKKIIKEQPALVGKAIKLENAFGRGAPLSGVHITFFLPDMGSYYDECHLNIGDVSGAIIKLGDIGTDMSFTVRLETALAIYKDYSKTTWATITSENLANFQLSEDWSSINIWPVRTTDSYEATKILMDRVSASDMGMVVNYPSCYSALLNE